MERLTNDEVAAIIDALPGGVTGYCKAWGWLHFAEAVQTKLIDKNRTPAERALQEIYDLCDGKADVVDGSDGIANRPNDYMRIERIIEAVLR